MIKSKLRRIRRQLFESFGSDRYSWPALNGLDRKIVELFKGRKSGYFIEVGGNDGYAQSNTYYLERFLGWRGILVEPIPRLYNQCVKERPRSVVYNCALVANSHQTPTVKIQDVGLMSVVKSGSNLLNTDEHAELGLRVQGLVAKREINIAASTLTELLEQAKVTREIDLLSLDVEGYEIEVLKGFDLNIFKPKFIVMEVRDADAIIQLIGVHYQVHEVLSVNSEYSDVLYLRRN